MDLFDSVERTNDPPRYTESPYGLLNRLTGPQWDTVRSTLERWYADYPDYAKEDLRRRFRQSDPHQHDGAWWELYTFSLFRNLGYTIEVHPPVEGSKKRPDMLATRKDSRVYVECAATFDTPDRAREDSEAWLKDCINKVPSPDFGFGLRINSAGSLRPQKADVIRQIETWVTSLDYEAERAAEAHAPRQSMTFTFADWRVTLTALPYLPDHRGNDWPRILYGPATSVFGDVSTTGLRKLLHKKSHQCRGVTDPLIVAILGRKMFARNEQVEKALIGSTEMRYRLTENGDSAHFADYIRNTDGLWHPGPPPKGARVSAVLYAEQFGITQIASRLPTLWVNPWAHRPLPEKELPFETHTPNDDGEMLQTAEAATSAAAIFSLPTGWPVT